MASAASAAEQLAVELVGALWVAVIERDPRDARERLGVVGGDFEQLVHRGERFLGRPRFVERVDVPNEDPRSLGAIELVGARRRSFVVRRRLEKPLLFER